MNNQSTLDQFVSEYIVTLIWQAPEDDNGDNLDAYTIDDMDTGDCKRIRDDCERFLAIAMLPLQNTPDSYTMAQAAHDYALTRNGHGVGFWDRGLGDIGEQLSSICDDMGEMDIYLGDDGKLYIA